MLAVTELGSTIYEQAGAPNHTETNGVAMIDCLRGFMVSQMGSNDA